MLGVHWNGALTVLCLESNECIPPRAGSYRLKTKGLHDTSLPTPNGIEEVLRGAEVYDKVELVLSYSGNKKIHIRVLCPETPAVDLKRQENEVDSHRVSFHRKGLENVAQR